MKENLLASLLIETFIKGTKSFSHLRLTQAIEVSHDKDYADERDRNIDQHEGQGRVCLKLVTKGALRDKPVLDRNEGAQCDIQDRGEDRYNPLVPEELLRQLAALPFQAFGLIFAWMEEDPDGDQADIKHEEEEEGAHVVDEEG